MRDLINLFVEHTKRRWLLGCLSTLISIPVFCGCLLFLTNVVLPFMDNLARGGDENAIVYVLLGGGLVSFLILLVIPVIILLVVLKVRARSLDAIFTPLGFSGSSYLLYGRHYQGQLGGRDVDIYIYRGPTIELRMKTRVLTRTQFFHSDSIPVNVARVFDKQPLESLPGLEGYTVYPMDEAWTRRWLTDEQAQESIRTLMGVGAEWAIFRTFELQPGEVLLHLYRSRNLFVSSIPLDAARTWLSALEILARSAENQPVPEVTDKPFQADLRQSRQRINKFQTYAIAFIVFVMPLCFIGIGVLVYLIVSTL
jgi:hypothetical protein